MSRPRVNTRCLASRYQDKDEKIVEISDATSGCLLSIRRLNGLLVVRVYRCDDDVRVSTEDGHLAR